MIKYLQIERINEWRKWRLMECPLNVIPIRLNEFIGKIDESVQVFDIVGPDKWETECYWPPGPEPVRVEPR